MSAIDALTTLVRGQKLPIFSVPGLPHLQLATQVAAQATAAGTSFRVVFAGMGLTHADAALVRDALGERSEAGELVMLLNTANDPIIERLLTLRIALTVAEHLAFTAGHHVLVVMSDMTSYCDAVPDLTGYITEGQVVLSPDAHARGVYPPVDVLSSLSRLMRKGAGPRRTREDHLDVAAQVIAALARARQASELADLVGITALSETDRTSLDYRSAVEEQLLSQGTAESRTLEQTLGLAWNALAVLPRRELTMLPAGLVETYLGGGRP